MTTTTTRRKITPDIASKMLERNKENRPLREGHVASLAAEMKAGRWQFNGDTICFSGDRLIDGQHRLWAVMESGVAIDALVVEGLDDKCFMTKDVGKRRSYNDMLHNAGYRGAPGLASAAALVHKYFAGTMMDKKAISNGVILETIAKHPALEEIVRSLPKRSIITKAVLATLRYLTGKVDNQTSEAFCAMAVTGVGIKHGEPVGVLHQYFINRRDRGHRLIGPPSDLAVCIKAWNAMRTGRKIELLQFNSSHEYPQVDGLATKTTRRKAV